MRLGEALDNPTRARRSLVGWCPVDGGPLAPATVDQVVLFAEHLASEALITSLDAKLAGKTIAGHFGDRLARVAEMQRRLRLDDPDDPPGEIIFPGPTDPVWGR